MNFSARRSFIVASSLVGLTALFALGCGPSSEIPSKYPSQKAGCAVEVFQMAPGMPTDNIGPVSATCGDDISDDDCLRTLKDEVCTMGGNIVWQVEPKPTVKDGKKRWSGRAAHTR